MPPRSNLAVQSRDERPHRFDFTGRRLKLVPTPPIELDTEASPMLEAIRRYLDALP